MKCILCQTKTKQPALAMCFQCACAYDRARPGLATTLDLMRWVAKAFSPRLSTEQLGFTGCDAVPGGRVTWYEPAVLLPDGTVWRKP